MVPAGPSGMGTGSGAPTDQSGSSGMGTGSGAPTDQSGFSGMVGPGSIIIMGIPDVSATIGMNVTFYCDASSTSGPETWSN